MASRRRIDAIPVVLTDPEDFVCSTIETPSVVGLLKNILSQYPDSGQIIKELVQNGEDAGARTIEVLHMKYTFQCQLECIRRFVKGPALCLYNDAVFSEEDWRGIRMLSDSIKKADPVKVGQFGLGFKSVFHMTDYVTIISGDSVLFMDPSEPECTMCRKTSLKTLTKYVSENECLALWGNVHLEREHLISGIFPGTIFWFPLRQKPSLLSKTVYDRPRVDDLFVSFGTEIPFTLTFLKSLESVALIDCESDCRKSIIKQIKLESKNISQLRNQRNEFLKVLSLCHQAKGLKEAKTLMYEVELKLAGGSGVQHSSQKLCILHYLPEFSSTRDTSSDAENVRLPLVGVAASLSEMQCGKIFCFLPLPLSSDNNTHLPVQVNGAFILDQNRRHVKWKSEDSGNEPDVNWNEKLVAEVLPEAYIFLIKALLKRTGSSNSNRQAFYRLLPDIEATSGRWRELAVAVWQNFLPESFLYSEAKMIMMRPCDVVSTHTLNLEPAEVKKAVLKTLTELEIPLSTFPESLRRSLVILKAEPKAVTPNLLRTHLKADVTRVHTEPELLLQFILSDETYSDLEGVPLLPLENSQWICFSRRSSTVYLCSKKEKEALKGLEHKVVRTSLTAAVLKALEKVAKSGSAQLKAFNVLDHGASLLKESVAAIMKYPRNANDLTLWLKEVWCLIQPLPLRNVSDLMIVPTTEPPNVSSLIPLTSPIIVQRPGSQLSKTVSETLRGFYVQVLSLPAFIKHCEISEFLNESNSGGINSAILKALRLHGESKLARDFNMNCNEDKICSLIDTIDYHSMGTNLAELFKGLKLFLALRGKSEVLVSLKECQKIYPKGTKFPICIPEPMIKIRGPKELEFAKWLGAKEMSEVDLCCSVMDQGCSCDEMNELFQFIVMSPHLSADREVIARLRNRKFVPNQKGILFRASDLYSPDESWSAALAEDYFPSSSFIHHLQFLKTLGLKSPINMPKQTVIDIIRSVGEKAGCGDDLSEKVNALLGLVDNHIDCAEICSSVINAPFVQGALQPVAGYPLNPPWATSTKIYKPSEIKSLEKFENLIGYVYPLVACRHLANVTRNFGWDMEPSVDIIIQQLKKVTQYYKGECLQNSNFVCLVKRVYETLTSYCETSKKIFLKELEDKECILTDNGFKKSHEVFINSGCNDLKLIPFVYPVHSMYLEQRGLFLFLGAYKEQTPAMYVSVLRDIHEAHKSGKRGVNEIDYDRSLIASILQKLQLHLEDINQSELLLPVESADGSLEMEMAVNCTYSEKSSAWLQDDMEEMGVKIVHNCVSPTLARALGVDPLTKHLFKEQEAIMKWEQKEPLTTRIHNLLRHYRDGLAVLKELVQNADDAGAEEVCFMYDEREGLEARSKLISEEMAEFQGPALWAFNNAEFTNEDLRNIIKLGCATKEQQASKIGKFGLGFCSVYNLTDVPSFVSGSSYVIFDPHMRNICDSSNPSAGIKYDLSKRMNKIMLRKLNDQLKPFHGMFNFDIDEEYFKGSLFRLPLRTRTQAEVSEISSVVYGHSEMIELLSMFMKMAGNLLLFTQSIQEIKVYHLRPSVSCPKKANVLLHVSRKLRRRLTVQEDKLKTINSGHTQMQYAFENLNCGKIFNYNEILFVDIRLQLSKFAELCSLTKNDQTVGWLVSWNSGSGEAIGLARKLGQGTLPLAAVAVPVWKTGACWTPLSLSDLPAGFYQKSHMHCFLPLPIQTCFSVHINGYFQVASDRTSLKVVTEDDRSYVNWNTCLMRDAVIAAWFRLLSIFRLEGLSMKSPYHELWPQRRHAKDALYLEMVDSFYAVIVTENPSVFRHDGQWCALSKCWFLENQFLRESIGKSAFTFLARCLQANESILVEIPEKIVEGFMDSSFLDKIITSRIFLLNYFLPNMLLDYITDTEKEKLMLYAFDSLDHEVLETVRNVNCIPTLPKYKLRKPAELLHPKVPLAQLFSEDDERFPTKAFSTSPRIDVLIKLGMMDSKLPLDMVIERVQTVSTQACSSCAVKRARAVINYMAHQHQQRNDIAIAIKETEFLPVMKKPEDWPFSWKGSRYTEKKCKPCDKHKAMGKSFCLTFSLCSPSQACSSTLKELIGGIKAVHQCLGEDESKSLVVLKALGIPAKSEEVPLQLVIKQLQLISSEMQEGSSDKCFEVIHNIYRCIDRSVKKSEISLEMLEDEEILLTNNGFKRPNQFALSEESHCPPDFFSASVEGLNHHYKHFLQAVGIQKRFGPELVLNRLREKGNELRGRKLSEKEVQNFSRLLDLLFKELMSSDVVFSLESILLPDERCYLQYTKDLCIEDGLSVGRHQFNLIHPDVALSKEMAHQLGILSKSRKMYRQSSRRMKFGQKEPLTTRLRNILKDYPCDSGIMKELLQNADDAGATEICFIKDFRNHATEKLIDPGWSDLQGPALCIYNNSSFTEEDLESIQNLGDSSKIYDPVSTGQYGIGFNAVYHLTDAPSFLIKSPKVNSGETLCLFDPHCWYDPDATPQSPGVRLQELEDLRVSHPDSFKVYLEENVMNKEGTLFRLPLRQHEHSQISKGIVTTHIVNDLLEEFIKDMKKCLLFLRSVRKISIASINDNGILETEYWVQSSKDDRAKTLLDSLTEHIKLYRSSSIGCNMNLYEIPRKRAAYQLNISDSKHDWQCWYVVQQIGTSKLETVPKAVRDAFQNRSICMLPHGGVALLLTLQRFENELVSSEKTLMSTSCYLPLPINSGLPFSVNGHFALDAARRDLWVGEDCKTVWNEWLMKEVIAPAVVQALHFWQSTNFTEADETFTRLQYEQRICTYYKCFPSVSRIEGKKWKPLITSVYFHIKAERCSLFDVYIPMKDEMLQADRSSFSGLSSSQVIEDKCCGTIEWWPLEHESSKFPMHFGILSEENSDVRMHFEMILNSLKRLNMKIGSRKAFDLVSGAGVQVPVVDPTAVLDFLHSWTEDAFGTCKIKVSVDIKETGFQSIDNVCNILQFVSRCKHFSERVHALPLLVTEDSLLQSFSESSPVFVSTYSSLLPKLKEKFVHYRMVKWIQALYEKLSTCTVVRDFRLDDLIGYLPQVLGPLFHGEGDIKLDWKNKELMNWLKTFWKFIGSSQEEFTKTLIHWKPRKKKILCELGEWALYPVNVSKSIYIIPISMAKYTLAPTWKNKMMFAKLSLPFALTSFADHEEFCTDHTKSKPRDSCSGLTEWKLEEFCTDHTNPCAFVELLYVHREQLFKDSSGKAFTLSARKIMEHIADFGCKVDTHKLRCLPLYEDVVGKVCSVESTTPIICPRIPIDGLHKIGEAAGFVLLNEDHEKIYRFLDCKMTQEEIYKDYILPMLDHICQEDVIKHMEHLKQVLQNLEHKSKSGKNMEGLVSVLKKTPFILFNSKRVTADVFTDHEVPVFRVMSPCTLPKPWGERKWNPFLKMAGMRHKVTPALFMTYAHLLTSSENCIEKSKVLVEHLFSNIDDFFNSINEVSAVEFLVPEIKPNLGSFLPFFKTPSGFTSFKDGIEQKFAEVVWTKAALLPSYAEPSDIKIKSVLQVHCKPPSKIIVNHLQNFCRLMKENGVPTDLKEFETVMDKIYEHLDKCHDSVIENLKGDPIIHIPKHNVMVAPLHVVEELYEEIPPYLYQAPRRYGKFSPVFLKLGVLQKATCTTYANVLEYIFNDSRGKKLNPEESRKLGIALKCMTKPLFELRTLKCTNLFLPSSKETLIKSTDMYFADIKCRCLNRDILDKPVLVNLEVLKIDVSTSEFVSHLPKHLKPVLLSTVLVEEFDSSSAIEVDTPLLRKIKAYFASHEFRHGCLRLMSDRKLKENSPVTSEMKKKVLEIINSVVIIQVQEIKLRYLYKCEEVSRGRKKFFLQNICQNNGLRKLYISGDISKVLVINALGKALKDLSEFIETIHLQPLLAAYKRPFELETIFDDIGVSPYEETNRRFLYDTSPGAYLSTDFIHMLDNDFHRLNIGEIVAMKQYLVTNGEDDDVFIIVRVHGVIGQNTMLMQEYEVETGYEASPVVKVKGLQLYRFVRSEFEEDCHKELVLKGEESEPVFSESEIMEMVKKQLIEIWKFTDEKERRHLLRRLLLKWHPDKNLDRTEICTRIVQYIHSLVSRLEQGENIADDKPSKAGDNSSTSYEDLFRSPPRYYTRPSGSFRSSRSRRSYGQKSKYSDRHTANVWMQQADHDLQEARYRENGGSPCWIVYMCHQASEKAIIAALYLEDRDTAVQFQKGSFNRSLSHPAKRLTSHKLLLSLCLEMEDRIQKHVNMRYPIYRSAPCNVYERHDADFMVKKASKLISLIKERFSG